MRKVLLLAATVMCTLPILNNHASGQAVGPEFRINEYTITSQGLPQVSALTYGGFVAVWQSYNQDGDDLGIFGRIYNSSGAPVTSEFLVNTYTASGQYRPHVTDLPSGGFLVTWSSYYQDGDGAGIFGQRFDSAGNKIGPEFQINSYVTGTQWQSVASADGSGNFVVAWAGEGPESDPSTSDIYVRWFDSSGNAMGTELRANAATEISHYPNISHDPSGNFILVWHRPGGEDEAPCHVYGRRGNSSGNFTSSQFEITSLPDPQAGRPKISHDSAGNSVVVWHSGALDPDMQGINCQLYNSSGNPVGTEFLVNTTTAGFQGYPDVAFNGMGNFIVTWYSNDVSSYGIFAQLFSGTAAKVGTEFQVNTYTDDRQDWPAIASYSNSMSVIVWQSRHQDGGNEGIYAQRYDFLPVSTLFEEAEARLDGNVVYISWNVQSEEGVEGFNIYRRERSDAGSEVLLTQNPLRPETRSFSDGAIRPGAEYLYEVSALRPDGSEVRSVSVTIMTRTPEPGMRQNYPNPFNPSTSIEYTISRPSHVNISIFDVNGRFVKTLENRKMDFGTHAASWDGKDSAGAAVQSGVYFYSLKIDGRNLLTRKMVLLR